MSDTPLPPPGWHPVPGDPNKQRWWNGTQWTDHVAERPPAAPAAPAFAPAPQSAYAPAAAGPLLVVTSHDGGRNARVELWPDRIEREKPRSRASVSKARQDTDVTPMKAVTSVRTEKDGVRFTKVIVYISANTIEFRLSHAEAQSFKNAIMSLVLAT